MKIYLATWLEANQAVTLTKAQAENRLMSYFFISQDKDFDVRAYTVRGIDKRSQRVGKKKTE